MFNLKKLLDGAVADINLWDGGKSHGNMSGAPRPASTAQKRNVVQKAFDEVNPFDNGKSWNNAQPTTKKALWQQALDNPVINQAGAIVNAKIPGLGVSTGQIAAQVPSAVGQVGGVGYNFVNDAAKGTKKALNTAQLPFAKANIERDYKAGRLNQQQALDRFKAEYDQAGLEPIVVRDPNNPQNFRISSKIEEGTATPLEFGKQIGSVGIESGLEIAPMVSGMGLAPTKQLLAKTTDKLIAQGVNPTAQLVRSAVAKQIAGEGIKDIGLFGTAQLGKTAIDKNGQVGVSDVVDSYKNAAVNELMGLGFGNIVSGRGWGGNRIGGVIDTAVSRAAGAMPTRPVTTALVPDRPIANNAPMNRRPVTTKLVPNPDQAAEDLAASQARAIDPNVQARRVAMEAPRNAAPARINMSPDDQRILSDFNDIANGVYTPDAKLQRKIEYDATQIAEKYGIPLRSTPQEMADEFDNVLQRGVTKPEFAPKPPRQTNQLAPKPSRDPIVNPKTGETLSQSVKKLEGFGWAKKDIDDYKNKVLGIKDTTPEIKPYKLENNTLYHGTSRDNIDPILKSGFKSGDQLPENAFRGGGHGATQSSISFSTDAKQASVFGAVAPRGAVLQAELKPGAKVVTVRGIDYAEDLNDRIPELRKKGIDAVYLDGEKEVVVINKAAAKATGKYKEFKAIDAKNTDFADLQPKQDPLEALKAEARKYKSAGEFSRSYDAEELLYKKVASDISAQTPKELRVKPTSLGVLKGNLRGSWVDNGDAYTFYPKKSFSPDWEKELARVVPDAKVSSGAVDFPKSKYKSMNYEDLGTVYNQATKPQIIKQEIPKSWTKPKTAFEQNTGVTAPTRKKGTLNTERLDLTDAQKADLASRQDPILETMSHKEIQDIAKSVGIDTRSHTIDQTKEIIAKQLNTRREVVALEKQAADLSSKGGDPVKLGNLYARIDELSRASTEQATDLGRQLSARRILADESKSPVQRVFGLLRKAGVNPEVYTKEAVGVNFNNPNEVIKYYRKLVPPTKGEWLDVVRYNSMLSSPLTQIVNVSSTAGNISIAPIERTIASNLDFIHSLATGKPRKFAGGEGRAYAKGMVKSFPDAVRAFKDSIKGLDENMNLDVGTQGGHVPIAAPGQNKLVDIAEFPMKLLGAFDNFHRTLVAGGSDAALSRRMQAGIKVRNPEMVNAAEGAYRTFNQDIGEKSQGSLLQGIDEVTAAVNRLRSSKHAVIRLPAKFTLPFVRIGANLMKQGIEYSPAGLATIPGAQDKTAQLAKTLMGTAVFGTAAGLLGQGRLTWSEPTNADQKAAFRAAGKQPYSMKIGNNWIGFSKLPPIISFNMAMVAALDDVQKNAKINDGGVDNILTAIAKYSPEAASKYGKFLADQSYVKSVGDLLSALQGDKEKLASLASNYPQQLVPERALLGWFAKMSDGTQRKINTDAGFAAKQVESLMQQIPGLRQQTTARVNEYGEPIASQHPVLNAFSPVPVSTENPDGVLAYDTMVNRLKTKRDDKALLAKQKEDYKSGNASGLTDKQKAAVDRSIREDEVVKGLTPVQRELYKYSKEDLESLLDGPNAKNAKVALDAKNNISSSKEAKTNKEKYEQALEKFKQDDKEGKISEVNRAGREKEITKLNAQKDYSKDTVDLYGKTFKEMVSFVNTNNNGKKYWEEIKALDKAMVDAGYTSKLYNKNGSLKATSTAKGGKAKKGKFDYSKRLATSQSDFAAIRNLVKRPKYSRKKVTIS